MNSEPPLITLTNPELEDWLRMSSSHVLFHWDTLWVKTNRLVLYYFHHFSRVKPNLIYDLQ